jgi:hypothetical protein
MIQGKYLGTRFGITNVIISNYDNDFRTKLKKRYYFDIIGNLTFCPTRYTYANARSYTSKNNNILGFGTSIRYGNKNWLLHTNLNASVGIKQITDELVGRNYDATEFWQIPAGTVSIGITKFFR